MNSSNFQLTTAKESLLNCKYSKELQVFAATLLFYSPKAYNYVRETFSKALPHETTVRRWFSNVDGTPGFSEPAFQLLEDRVAKGNLINKQVLVSLMLDETSVKKQVDYDAHSGTYKGCVNMGFGSAESEDKLATDALIIMAVGVNWHFKNHLAYFFVSGKHFFDSFSQCCADNFCCSFKY